MAIQITGTTLVASRPYGLHIADLLGASAPIAVEIAALHAFTAVGDEAWVVAGSPPQLQRYALRDGTPQGAPMIVSSPPGTLVPGAHVVWLAAEAWQLTPQLRSLGAVDFAVALGAHRTLIARGEKVTLRDRESERWTSAVGGRVERGTNLFDGRSVALVIAHARGHAVVVIDLANGKIQQRLELQGATHVELAPRRNAALAVLERRRVVLIDLRFGELLASYTLDADVEHVAVDERGQFLATQFVGQHDIELANLQAPSPPVSTPEIESVAVPIELAPVVEPAPIVEESLPVAPVRDLALDVSILEARGELVAADVALAVARAWDRGRIAFPDAGAPPFRSVVAGTLGMQRGLASADLEAARTTVAHAQANFASVATAASTLDRLAEELGLSHAAKEILWVVAAPHLWGELARLYGILANDDHRPLCDEHLVSEILAERVPRHVVHAELDPRAPLCRHGLVAVGAGTARPFLALAVPGVVLALLRGSDPRAELPASVEPRAVAASLDRLYLPAAVRDGLRRDLAAVRGPLRLAVRGRTGAGRRSLIAAVVGELGIVHAGRDPGALRLALLLTRLAGLTPVIDGLDAIAADDTIAWDAIRRVLDDHPGPLALRCEREGVLPLGPGHVMVQLPAQTATERAEVWRSELAAAGLVTHRFDELVGRFTVGPGVIARVCRELGVVAAGEPPHAIEARLDRAVRQHLANRLGAIATRVDRLATWSHVVLPSDVQTQVSELIGRIRNRRVVFERWGFDQVMSSSRGVVALFQGGPGTGKTLVAGAIANELGVELYKVDVSRVISKWVGETEQNLSRLFDAAEDGNAIVLFDEADSLFAKRTEVKSSNDRYANLGVNYLLERLDRFEGVAILTTNLAGAIDNAFSRRLSSRVTFPFPEEDERERLWRAHLPSQLPTHGDLDLGGLARRYRMSGGYIRNAALRAAFLAAEQGSALTASHLTAAIRSEYRELGKLADTGMLS